MTAAARFDHHSDELPVSADGATARSGVVREIVTDVADRGLYFDVTILGVFVGSGVDTFIHQNGSGGSGFRSRISADHILEAVFLQVLHVLFGMTHRDIRNQSSMGQTFTDVNGAFSSGFRKSVFHEVGDRRIHVGIEGAVSGGRRTLPRGFGGADQIVLQTVHGVTTAGSASVANHAGVALRTVPMIVEEIVIKAARTACGVFFGREKAFGGRRRSGQHENTDDKNHPSRKKDTRPP